MATLTAIAYNMFETVGLVQPRIEIAVREIGDGATSGRPLQMKWIYERDESGRKVIRIQWAEAMQQKQHTHLGDSNEVSNRKRQ